MSINPSRFQNYSYIKDNGVNKYLIENYLLPGLISQARFAKASRGIPLPVPYGKPLEFIPLQDAAAMVLDWLEYNNNLREEDNRRLSGLLKKVSYEQFADLASELYGSRIEDPNKLLTVARLQNLADYRAAQKIKTAPVVSKFDPGKAIDDYNQLYLKLLSYSRTGVPASLLKSIVPAGIPIGSGNLTQATLASIISHNLTELRSAAKSHSGDQESQSLAVGHALGNIIATSYPEQSGYLNLLGNKAIASNLNSYTEQLENTLVSGGDNLNDLEHQKILASTALDDSLFTQKELYQKIQAVLPFASDTEKKAFTTALIKSINSSSARPLSSREIIELAGTRLGVNATKLSHITSSLKKEGLDVSLEFRQNEISVLVGSHYLTAGEKGLLRRGINPFLTHQGEASLVISQTKLLQEYQQATGTPFNSITEAQNFEMSQATPNIDWLRRFRSHEDQLGGYLYLDNNEKSFVNRTRFGRSVANIRSRLYETQAKFFNKWIEFDENLPWNKGVRAAYEWYDKIAENTLIPGTKIPLFRIVPWLYDRIDEWKKVTTLGILARTENSTSTVGKFINWTFTKYKLGDFTVNGASFEAFRSVWGSSTKWALERSAQLATSLGVGSAFKYASVSASRTATRLLISVGGKALARFGEKAVVVLVAAGTAIGSVFSGILLVGMVWDLAKLGFNFIAEFFRNGEFRKTIIGWGATIAAFVVSINFGGIFIAATILFAGALQSLLLGLVVIAGIVFFNNMNLSDFQTTIQLDSGLTQVFTNIVCDQSKSEGADPVAICANCLVEYLTACYGPSVTGSSISSKGLGCLIAKSIAPEVASTIEQSAIYYNYLQCVGFVQASVQCAGGSLEGRATAALFINNAPSGWRYISGSSGAKPGDIGLINGDIGHIFVWGKSGGPYVNAIDANFVCDGCVSASNPIPLTSVAGYLTKN